MAASRSSVSRVVSASGAAWTRIAITVVSQVALVPLYLSSWNPETYGAWLLLQAVWSFVIMIDMGHQDYVGYECLRAGPTQRTTIVGMVASALPMALLIALCDLLLVWVVSGTATAGSWAGMQTALYEQWRYALTLQAVCWLLIGSSVAMIVKGLTPFGYFPRIAWWNTFYALATAAAPGIAVVAGADLLGAAIVFSAVSVLCNLGCAIDLRRLTRAEHFLAEARVSPGTSVRQLLNSLWLIANGLSSLVRQQGVRVILTPLSSVPQMAAFSTMRTGANFALQGLGTITAPLMPELMRFLAARDQQRTESAFAVVWLALCAALAPAILVIQYLAPIFFPIWTRGKIDFDPALFSLLSAGVLLFALVQPAAAVVTGNNLLKAQLSMSVLAGVLTVSGMFLLVPVIGMRGAALALVLAELVNLCVCVYVASRWLRLNGLRWPVSTFQMASTAVAVVGAGLAVMSLLPHASLPALALSLFVELTVTLLFWRTLPLTARQRAAGLAARFLPQSYRSRWLSSHGQ